MRVGVLAIQHESNTFVPSPTTLSDFESNLLALGSDVVEAASESYHEVGGFLEGLREEGLEAVPILFARATPGGMIAADTADSLVGMAMDPDWIIDMVQTYSKLIIELQEILFAEEGKPDGIFYYEDMGFSGRPFMSPDMYDEIIKPGHKKTIDYNKSLGLPVTMHSCGMIERLLPGMLDAGIDCLQVIEVKAGMDLIKLYQQYGDRLSFFGGIDVRELYSNDLKRVEAELESKIPIVMQNFGYILHSDHSIPNTVHIDTYRHFVEYGLKLGTYQIRHAPYKIYPVKSGTRHTRRTGSSYVLVSCEFAVSICAEQRQA